MRSGVSWYNIRSLALVLVARSAPWRTHALSTFVSRHSNTIRRGCEAAAIHDERVDWSNEEIRLAAKSAAKLGGGTKSLWEECSSRMASIDGSGVADIAWAYARVGEKGQLLEAASVRARLAAVERWSPREASLVAWALAKGDWLDREASMSLGRAMVSRADEANGRDWSTMAWALATARQSAPNVMDQACRFVRERYSEVEPQSAATLAWAMATMERRQVRADPQAMFLLARKVRELNLTPRSVALAAWAFAATNVKRASTEAAHWVAAASFRVAGQLENSRDAATLLWAIGTLQPRSEDARRAAIEALARAIVRSNWSWSPRCAANALWSMAKAGVAAPSLRAATSTVVDSMLDKADQCVARDFADAAWAVTMLNVARDDLARAIVDSGAIAHANPSCLVRFAFAFTSGLTRVQPELAMDQVAARALLILDQVDHRQLAVLAKNVAEAATPTVARRFLAAVAHVSLRRSDLQAADLCTLALALSKCNVADSRRVLIALADRASSDAHRLSPKQRADLAQALVASGAQASHPFFLMLDQSAQSLLQPPPLDSAVVPIVPDDGSTSASAPPVVLDSLITSNTVFPLPPDHHAHADFERPPSARN